MVSLGHGTLSFKGSLPERSQSSVVDYGKNAHKKKLEQQLEKKRWEMNINLSQYNPRREKQTIIKVSTFIIEYLTRIYLNLDALHVIKEDTMIETVLRTKMALTRRKETRKDIMLMLHNMMSLPRRESNKTMMILQVMKNMF